MAAAPTRARPNWVETARETTALGRNEHAYDEIRTKPRFEYDRSVGQNYNMCIRASCGLLHRSAVLCGWALLGHVHSGWDGRRRVRARKNGRWRISLQLSGRAVATAAQVGKEALGEVGNLFLSFFDSAIFIF